MTNLKAGIFIFCSFIICVIVKCYPVKRSETENKAELKEEKRYPNGTIIGKYTYKDKEGNPIHVKYYADDSSYGVELKSVKILGSNSEMQNKLPKLDLEATANSFGASPGLDLTNTVFSKEFAKNTSYNPYDLLNNYPKIAKKYKGNYKAKDDYEIFLENDLQPSEHCKGNNGKVKIYSDKNKRKSRNVNKYVKPTQISYCERF